ncbi:unnamed protein product [Allacma fusca]|uniref:Signal transducer and activator of transcription n=1 Tax=Allacma fusca TaxID=39272 RepID=A0A8J2KNE1_9HEXA|nr:unnamed protein product [Allacma fusca]
MSLLQAIQALPTGPSCYAKLNEWGCTLWQYRQYFPEFLERTLCTVVEDPTEDEVNQWYSEFETMQQNCINMSNGYQEKLYAPVSWYKAFKSCLKEELDFVEQEWLRFAEMGLQVCINLHQQILNTAITFEGYNDIVPTILEMSEITGTVPLEQQLLDQLTQVVNTTCWCVAALLEYKTYFRPSYFSNMSTEFQNWGREYRSRFESIQNIRFFLQKFFAQSALWQNLSFKLPTNFDVPIQQMRHLSDKVDLAIRQLVSQAMIVTQQPQGTIKKETKFDLEVQIFGTNLTYVGQTRAPSVTVINETQAETLHREGLNDEITHGCGRIQSCKPPQKPPTQVYQDADKTMTVTYERMGIPERPQDISRTRAVLRQKFVILFHTVLKFEGLPIRVWTCSTPFVYTTNVSQDCEASATIFWDTYVFYKSPFNIKSNVSAKLWQVQAALSRFITKETSITWAPNQRSLTFLMEKMLGYQYYNLETLIDRATIDEQRDPESGVTFWKWFISAIKLLKEDFSAHWQKGYIVGFIDREIAEKVIQEKRPETFMLRFSSSQVGGLSITFKGNVCTDSSIFPTNERGQLAADLNQFISEMNPPVKYLLYINSEGHFVQKHKDEIFTTNSAPPSPENYLLVNGRKPGEHPNLQRIKRFQCLHMTPASASSQTGIALIA